MPFTAKKLRVALPTGEIVGEPGPRILPVALDLDAITDEVTGCFGAAQPQVTTVCFSHTCVDVFSDPVYAVVASAELLPALREALEAQLEEVAVAERALAERQAEG
jgi:hypothetical protein